MIISKALLTAVLGENITEVNQKTEKERWKSEGERLIYYTYQGNYTSHLESINIHELAHKYCKEWAHDKGYTIKSWTNVNHGSFATVSEHYNRRDNDDERLISDTEPKAIFKACEWIFNEIALRKAMK